MTRPAEAPLMAPDIEALTEAGEAATLTRLLGHTDPDVRAEAAEALANVGDSKAVEPLMQLLDDEVWDVRSMAVLALGRLGDDRAVEALVMAMLDPEEFVRNGAIDALASMGHTAVPPLIEALTGDQPELAAAAVDALGAMGGPAVEPLLELLQAARPEVRVRAASALGDTHDPRAILPLYRLLDDTYGHARSAAGRALGKLAQVLAIRAQRLHDLLEAAGVEVDEAALEVESEEVHFYSGYRQRSAI